MDSEPISATHGVEGLSVVRRKLADYLILGKVRLSLMVLASALVSFWFASGSAPNWLAMIRFALGTFLVIAGANAFNQVAERALDRLMLRTASRPLPTGRMTVREAAGVATLALMCGLGVLLRWTQPLTPVLAATAAVVYLLVYTPLKRLTHWSTFAGAISGAIPALMGWSAVRGQPGSPAWALFAIVFLWQFPHTWSIVSTYREDYLRAGYQVLPLVDPDGNRTRRQVIAFSLALAAVSLLPAALGVAGSVYLAGALIGGTVFVALAVRFGRARTRRLASQLMAASLLYMPLILTLLVFDRKVI